MVKITAERQLIKAKRIQVLDEENALYLRSCGKCTKISEARSDDSIPNDGMIADDGYKYSTKPNWSSDRRNPICDSCPFNKQMRDFGRMLEQLTKYDRALK